MEGLDYVGFFQSQKEVSVFNFIKWNRFIRFLGYLCFGEEIKGRVQRNDLYLMFYNALFYIFFYLFCLIIFLEKLVLLVLFIR